MILLFSAQYANVYMSDIFNSIERFQSPFCRTQLNSRELAESFTADESSSEN